MKEREQQLADLCKEAEGLLMGKIADMLTGDACAEVGIYDLVNRIKTAAPPTGTPAENRYGRDLEPKPLAQYLDEYIRHEAESDGLTMEAAQIWIPDRKLFEQALEAYQSTGNVTIKIERVTE